MSRRVAVKSVTVDRGEGVPRCVAREVAKITTLSLHPNMPNLIAISSDNDNARFESINLIVGDCSITLEEYVHILPDRMDLYNKCFKHLSQALSHTHQHGFSHGNLSPKGIYVRLPGADACETVFMIGDLSDSSGPLGYLAPEQLVFTSSDGLAADIWSLACIMIYYIRQRPIVPPYLLARTDVMAEICHHANISHDEHASSPFHAYASVSTVSADGMDSFRALLEENILTSRAITELKGSPRYVSVRGLSKKLPWSYICVEKILEANSSYHLFDATIPTLSRMLSFLPSQRPSIEVVCRQVGARPSLTGRKTLKSSVDPHVHLVLKEFVSELCREVGIPEQTSEAARTLFLSVLPVKRSTPTALACLLLAVKCSNIGSFGVSDICAYISDIDADVTGMKEKILEAESWLLLNHSDKMCSLAHCMSLL